MGIGLALPRQKRETAASLVQGQPKRNSPIEQAEAQETSRQIQDKLGGEAQEKLKRSRTRLSALAPISGERGSIRSAPRAARSTSRLRPNGRDRAPRGLVRAERGTRHRSSRGCLGWSTALISSGWSGCLASNHLLASPGAINAALRMRLFGARFPAQPWCGIARHGAGSQFLHCQKRQQVLAAPAVCIGC